MTTIPYPSLPKLRDPMGPLVRLKTILVEDAADLWRFRQVIVDLVSSNLKVRYQRSVLGFLWTLLNPLLMLATLTIVFSTLFKVRSEGFAVHLFAGLVPWGLLAGSATDGATCIIHNEGLIKKIYLPKLLFPVTSVALNAVIVALSMCALFLVLIPLGAWLGWSVLLLPINAGLFTGFCLGIALTLAAANTFFRDVGHMVTVLLQVWYFATPIIWPLDMLDSGYRWLVWLNPAFPFIQIFQVILHEQSWPACSTLGLATFWSLLSIMVGYAVFKSSEDKLVFRL